MKKTFASWAALAAGAGMVCALLGVTPANAAMQTVVLTVPTMDCATCPLTIKAALLKLPGVSEAKVSYLKREAVVEYDDAKTDLSAIKKATADAGYPSFLKD